MFPVNHFIGAKSFIATLETQQKLFLKYQKFCPIFCVVTNYNPAVGINKNRGALNYM